MRFCCVLRFDAYRKTLNWLLHLDRNNNYVSALSFDIQDKNEYSISAMARFFMCRSRLPLCRTVNISYEAVIIYLCIANINYMLHFIFS